MTRCPECGAMQTDPPTTVAEEVIDLRRVDIADAVAMDLTELDQAGRTLVEGELRLHSVPYRWDGDLLIVPEHADPIVRGLLESPRPREPQRRFHGGVVPDPTVRVLNLPDPDQASRLVRALAALGDLVVLAIVVLIPTIAWFTERTGQRSLRLTDGGVWFMTLAPVLYSTVFVALRGATPGKLLFHLRVRRVDGRRPDLVASTVRAVVPSAVFLVQAFLPEATLFDTGAGRWISSLWLAAVYVGILVHPQRRGLHDRLAGTVVVSLLERRLRMKRIG